MFTDKIINDLAGLTGTIGVGSNPTIESILEENGVFVNNLTGDEARELDNIVFACDRCGWYYDGDDKCNVEGEWYCEECYDEAMNEEDN